MTLDESLQATIATFARLGTMRPAIDAAGQLIVKTLQSGGRLLTCGNGGSAAEAQHLATELVGRYLSQRRSLPAVALTSDGTAMSCIANDYRWEDVFARQIEGLAQPGDLVVVFTTSGRSPNIVAALQTAKRLGLSSLALLGRDGGACAGLATVEVTIPGPRTASIQEAHLFLIHHFCEQIEAAFPAEPTA